MAAGSRTSFKKRQKEIARMEKQREKTAKRLERKRLGPQAPEDAPFEDLAPRPPEENEIEHEHEQEPAAPPE